MANSAEKKAFIEKMWNAIKGLDLNGLFASVLIAQAALESNWGTSDLSRKYNNYFGIKKHNWKGKTATFWTTEVKNGQKVRVQAEFRAYDTLAEGIADRNNFLRQNKRYALNGVFDAKTPQEQVQALKNAGYATATNYVSAIMSTINANNLTEYDNLKKKTRQHSNVILNNKEDKMGKNISIIVLVLGVAIVGISIFSLIKSIRK